VISPGFIYDIMIIRQRTTSGQQYTVLYILFCKVLVSTYIYEDMRIRSIVSHFARRSQVDAEDHL
jgi:hypothetical protein